MKGWRGGGGRGLAKEGKNVSLRVNKLVINQFNSLNKDSNCQKNAGIIGN